MTGMSEGKDKLGTPAKHKAGSWVQTERKAHEAWAKLIAKKPNAAILLHYLVAQMDHQNALVISQKTLSKIMNVHVRTVGRAIDDLVKERWIQIIQFGGKGTTLAYVVNDRVAWGKSRDKLRLSIFSATVVVDIDDQETSTLDETPLRKVPLLYPGERQLPDESHDEPPSQGLIPGFEPDLPTIQREKTEDFFDESLKIEEVKEEKK